MIVRQAEHSTETWYVSSDSSSKDYSVHYKFHPLIGRKVWTCNCPDFTERRQWHGEVCKHIDEVLAWSSNPTPYEVGMAKYGVGGWRLRHPDVLPTLPGSFFARRQAYESKLESALDSLKELLEEIRR